MQILYCVSMSIRFAFNFCNPLCFFPQAWVRNIDNERKAGVLSDIASGKIDLAKVPAGKLREYRMNLATMQQLLEKNSTTEILKKRSLVDVRTDEGHWLLWRLAMISLGMLLNNMYSDMERREALLMNLIRGVLGTKDLRLQSNAWIEFELGVPKSTTSRDVLAIRKLISEEPVEVTTALYQKCFRNVSEAASASGRMSVGPLAITAKGTTVAADTRQRLKTEEAAAKGKHKRTRAEYEASEDAKMATIRGEGIASEGVKEEDGEDDKENDESAAKSKQYKGFDTSRGAVVGPATVVMLKDFEAVKVEQGEAKAGRKKAKLEKAASEIIVGANFKAVLADFMTPDDNDEELPDRDGMRALLEGRMPDVHKKFTKVQLTGVLRALGVWDELKPKPVSSGDCVEAVLNHYFA
jgi:hypothetical protein